MLNSLGGVKIINSDEIVVSIIATAHRPKNWEVVFNSIVSNLKFEVIISYS